MFLTFGISIFREYSRYKPTESTKIKVPYTDCDLTQQMVGGIKAISTVA